MPGLEITKVVLVHSNIVNNDYQQDFRVVYTFIPNKLFGQMVTNVCLLREIREKVLLKSSTETSWSC